MKPSTLARINLFVAAGSLLFFRSALSAPDPEYDPGHVKIMPRIELKAIPFSLWDVRLLGGPFHHAMDLDHRYLVSLDPDRLLRNFRVNAGLPTTAKAYGGWEAPDCELRGHFVGHYLSACAKMYASTGDKALKKNADHVVAGLAECQAALHGGYLSAFPETFIDRVEARQNVWAPWYTLHKIYAGLLDMYLYTGSKQALEVATRMAAWAKQRTDRLTDDRMQRMLNTEQGGMNETLANLYAVTGDAADLALSERFNHRAVLDPLSRHEDDLTGLHANTQIPKIIGAARQYELTGDERFRRIATFFWDVVTKNRSYVIGGDSDGEHFTPTATLSRALSPNTTETCNTYNMLKLTRHLFTWDPKEEYADYYERALYNHILASQNPETGMMCYYVPLKPGARKRFSSPEDSFWCCTGTGVENHAQYGDSIYFREGTLGLFVNLFIASELHWKERGITLRQDTRFPEVGSTRLTFTCVKPVSLALHLRHPYWATAGFPISVNGKTVSTGSAPASFATISRTWKTGDTVEIGMPLTLHTEGFKDNPNRLAFLDGPIVLCAPVERGKAVPDIVAPAVASDAVETAAVEAAGSVRPVPGRALRYEGVTGRFRAAGTEKGESVNLSPFYGMHNQNYTVYWDVMTPAQWQAKEDARQAEEARQKELDARTVDLVLPNDPRSEQDHSLKSERSAAGQYGGRAWRDARDGGWFSYDLKVLPDTAQELVCTYWGTDVGREFDVLVDGARIATQRLAMNHPGEFFDGTYPLPAALIQGKERITVRFQAHPGGMAGGVFGCRVVKASPPR